MDPLVRRIKDLDQTTFQQLCFHVISERFPSAKVRYPEGAAGDEGVDLFEGDLSEGATVWQCKAFTVSIPGDSQKQQIRDSLRDAVKNVRPKLWILCLNLSLDIKAARWFRRLQESYARQGVAVADPFDAMDLARELMYRRTIRNHFFPNLALDVQELKSLMKAAASSVDSISDGDLETLATENSEELLDRLQRQDPRFRYEVTFGGERGPNVFPPPHEPHLISSMTDGRKTFKAYVRDHEALGQDPVGFTFEFSPAGGEKYVDLIRTGKPQTWAPEEVSAFRSTVPLLSSMKFVPGKMEVSVQSLPDDRVIPLKLSFSKSEKQATLDYVEFRKLRAGTHEVEIATAESNPLGMAFVLPFDKASEVDATIFTNFPGKPIRDVATACSALKLLQSGCTLELTSLKLNGHLCTLLVNPLPAPFKPKFFQFVEDLAAIADRFQVDLRTPDTLRLSPEEREIFPF